MFDLCRAEEVETQDVFVASFSPLAWIVHLGSLLSASQPVCQCSFTQDQIIEYLSQCQALEVYGREQSEQKRPSS